MIVLHVYGQLYTTKFTLWWTFLLVYSSEKDYAQMWDLLSLSSLLYIYTNTWENNILKRTT